MHGANPVTINGNAANTGPNAKKPRRSNEAKRPRKCRLSILKLRANRANARKSTGPRTPEGKRRSAQNARRHPLKSPAPVVPGIGERPTDYRRLSDALHADVRPRNAVEKLLVDQIVACYWRSYRAIRYENAAVEKLRARRSLERNSAATAAPHAPNAPDAAAATDTRNARTAATDHRPHPDQPPPDITEYDPVDDSIDAALESEYTAIPDGRDLGRLIRYESKVDRELYRALKTLHRLRTRPPRPQPPHSFDPEPHRESSVPAPHNAPDPCPDAAPGLPSSPSVRSRNT